MAWWPQGTRWPGTEQLVAVAATVPVGSGKQARLCTRDGTWLYTVPQVRRDARALRWRGRVFLHWQGNEWRQIDVVDVGGAG
jgi:hypothetical protein